VLHSDFNWNILSGKTARKHFWVVSERESVGFSLDAVVFLPDKICFSALVYFRKINVGQIEKHRISNKAVPAKQRSGNSAVCLFIH